MSSDNLTNNLDDYALLLQLVSMFQGFDVRLRGVGENLETRLTALETRLEALEKKVDERLYDTRPLWEAVRLQITELREQTEKGFRGSIASGNYLPGKFAIFTPTKRKSNAG